MMRIWLVLFVVLVATVCGLFLGSLLRAYPISFNEIFTLLCVFGLVLALLAQICGLSQWGMWVGIPMVFSMALLLMLIPEEEMAMGTVIGMLFVMATIASFIPEHENNFGNRVHF